MAPLAMPPQFLELARNLIGHAAGLVVEDLSLSRYIYDITKRKQKQILSTVQEKERRLVHHAPIIPHEYKHVHCHKERSFHVILGFHRESYLEIQNGGKHFDAKTTESYCKSPYINCFRLLNRRYDSTPRNKCLLDNLGHKKYERT